MPIDDQSDLPTAVGKRIAELRELRGVRQASLARLSGVPASSISQIERGVRLPSVPSLLAIVRALDVSADTVLGHRRTGSWT